MNIRTITILILASLALAGCAKPGMPTGGPKDVTPPKMLSITPPSGTLNSQKQDFYIEFDEYVVLKDAENNLIVSPPMKESPEVKTKGKGIKVTIKDSLQPNTTYLFQFKEAIADFNEGNLLPSLEYVFSTGNYIDSMSLSGKVVEALTMEADKDHVSVWLFDEERYQKTVKRCLSDYLSDTTENNNHVQPNYTTRTDKEGLFSFNNIKPGNYRIVAVKDEDKSLSIGVTETMAFTDSTIAAVAMQKPDTAQTGYKSLTKEGKTSAVENKETTLRLSTPSHEKQRLTSSKFETSGKVVLTSLLPLEAPKLNAGGENFVWRINKTCDTLTLWTLNKDCDSLRLVITDTTGINDTLSLKFHRKRPQKGAANINLTKKNIAFSTKSLPYFDTLALIFAMPVDSIRCRLDSVARIMSLKDSTIEYCNALLDSTAMRAKLLYRFRQGEKYSINIDKGLFYDIQGSENDSIQAAITVSKAEDYGNLTLTVENHRKKPDENQIIIVELLDEKGKALLAKTVAKTNKVKFENLKPGKYRIRTIIDDNGNGKWDSGDFATQQQPEQVFYFNKTLEIRANWDFDEKMAIE